jgi:hypothetical protein
MGGAAAAVENLNFDRQPDIDITINPNGSVTNNFK